MGTAASYLFVCLDLFAGGDSAGGAYGSTSTAVDASIGINNVDFAFGDSAYGALGQTSAACDTCIGNNVSHFIGF